MIICFGIDGCVASEVNSVGSPNNPDNAGKRTGEFNPIGDSTVISSMMIPNSPERINTNNANPIPAKVGRNFLVDFSGIRAFSVPIIKIVIQRSTKNMISCNVSYPWIGFPIRYRMGKRRTSDVTIAPRLPMAER